MADEVITKFLAPMPWSWSDLEGIGPAELYYGEIVGNAAGELTFCSNRHPTGLALGLLKRHEQAAGVVMQLRFLMTSFRRNVNELFSRYDPSEDGVVKTDLKGLPDVHFEASSLVYDVIVSGGRLVDHVEIALKSIFGAESEEYCTWREFASGFYDNCLPYALCYRLRNVIEHGFVAISTVNFNPRAGTVGLAINLEAGILQYEDLNAGLRDCLVEYRQQRLSEGLVPWLSVGGTLSKFEGVVLFLYLWFLLQVKSSDFAKGLPEIVKRGAGKANCLVWRVGDDVKHPLYSLDRVYRFVPTSTIIPIVEHDASEIRKRLKELDPEIGHLIDRLVSG